MDSSVDDYISDETVHWKQLLDRIDKSCDFCSSDFNVRAAISISDEVYGCTDEVVDWPYDRNHNPVNDAIADVYFALENMREGVERKLIACQKQDKELVEKYHKRMNGDWS